MAFSQSGGSAKVVETLLLSSIIPNEGAEADLI
jgi:hypothetical protein